MVSEFHIKISAFIMISLMWYEFTKGCCKTAWLIISTKEDVSEDANDWEDDDDWESPPPYSN